MAINEGDHFFRILYASVFKAYHVAVHSRLHHTRTRTCISSRTQTQHHTTPHLITPAQAPASKPNTTPHRTTPYHTIPHHTTPNHTTPHNTTLHHVTSHYTTCTLIAHPQRHKAQLWHWWHDCLLLQRCGGNDWLQGRFVLLNSQLGNGRCSRVALLLVAMEGMRTSAVVLVRTRGTFG